jgi:sec-independent protein translocase protein TatA
MNSLFTPVFAILGLGAMELMLVLAVVILLFGAKKLPDLAKGLGQSIKEFKKASKEADVEDPEKPAPKVVEPSKTHGAN